MRLSVHLIENGKAYLAGTDILDDEVSELATRYVEERAAVNREVSRTQTHDSMKRRLHSPKKETYDKRGNEFVPLSQIHEPLFKGEALYWHRKKRFGVSERFIKFSSVKS